jgi:biopolymer transport protein ExbD
MKIQIVTYLMMINIGLMSYACTDSEQGSSPKVIITITVNNEITVNADTISIDSLEAKLKDIGATNKTNIRIMPDPEAGAGTIEKVQRRVRVFKQSQQYKN